MSDQRRIESCHNDLIHSNNVYSIVNIIPWTTFSLNDCTFDIEVCHLIFANAYIILLKIDGMIKSFLKTNVLTFSNMSFPNLNSTVKMYVLHNMENIDLDSSILNKHIFQNIYSFLVHGKIKSIQIGVFKHFKQLKPASFEIIDIRQFFHKNGIEWIRNFNGDINVNLNQLAYMSNIQFL